MPKETNPQSVFNRLFAGVDPQDTAEARRKKKLYKLSVLDFVRTDAGWHIVQRVGTRQTDVTDQNRRAQIRETIGRRKAEDEYNRFLQELRGEAYVSFRTGDRAETTPGS